MDLLTKGAFSRASRLSPKALRLYDSPGLLTPAQAVGRPIDLANEAGGPDNIACVVADVVEPRQDPRAGSR